MKRIVKKGDKYEFETMAVVPAIGAALYAPAKALIGEPVGGGEGRSAVVIPFVVGGLIGCGVGYKFFTKAKKLGSQAWQKVNSRFVGDNSKSAEYEQPKPAMA